MNLSEPEYIENYMMPKKIFNKTVLFIFPLLILILFLCTGKDAYCIGGFSVGLNVGLTYAPNNIDDEIEYYNRSLRTYSQNNSGTQIKQIAVPYAPVFGINFRYKFNYLLFRLGFHLSQTLVPAEGSIRPAGGQLNKIRFRSFQNSIPLSVCFLLPLKGNTYFYLGGGGTLHQSYIRISQNKPVQTAPAFSMETDLGLSKNTRERYYDTFVGYHFIIGIEIPLTGRFTLSTEWIHQEGKSYPIDNNGSDENGNDANTPSREINVRGDVVLFGANYYISI